MTSQTHPTLIILAIDISPSMTKTFVAIGNKSLSCFDIGKQLVDRLLDDTVYMSYVDEIIKNRYLCVVIGYEVQQGIIRIKSLMPPTFSIDLDKKIVIEEEQAISDTGREHPVWIGIQEIDAFPFISIPPFVSFMKQWAQQNVESLPPVIINFTENSKRAPTDAFEQFQNIKTNLGETLIFNCFINKLSESTIRTAHFQELLEESSLSPRKTPPLNISTERKYLIPSLKKGTRIGNYVVVEKIGFGGVGAVYKAHHYILSQTVAIKVLERFPKDPIINTSFLQAANYLSQLNHPNIVRLYDYGLMQHKAYMAMEFVEGVTLEKIIPKMPSKAWTERAIFIFVQLLSAVRHAHSCVYRNLAGEQVRGIIHGDIKPANILINSGSDNIKLTDFMIPDIQQYLTHENLELRNLIVSFGTPFTGEEKENIIDRIMPVDTRYFGTPKYMPPEQWGGKVSIASDIFCMGATLYELLTGLPPMSLFKDTQPRQVNPFIPKWVEESIIRSMKAAPSERYNSVAEIESLFRENIKESNKSAFYFKELVMGNKIEFNNTGTINNNGQLFIGKFNDLYASLNTAGHTELAEALKTLKEAIMASKELSESQKQENLEIVNNLGDEALKDKPNNTVMKLLGEGLLSTLKTIPDIAKAIAVIAPFITGVK